MTILFKIVGFILAMITPLASLIVTDITVPFDKEIAAAEEKIGGFMKGVCHLDPQYELINEANVEWFRDDIPFPFNADGSISESYIRWKEESQKYVDNGIKIFGITPYPEDYIDYGLDPRKPECREGIQEIAKFYVQDLKGILGAFQVTN